MNGHPFPFTPWIRTGLGSVGMQAARELQEQGVRVIAHAAGPRGPYTVTLAEDGALRVGCGSTGMEALQRAVAKLTGDAE